MSKRLPFLAVAIAAAFAAVTPAQSQVLQVAVSTNGGITGVGLNGSASITAPGTGQAVFATVSVRYVGSTLANITSLSLTGTTEMTLQTPPLPVTLGPGDSMIFSVQYVSTAGLTAAGQVLIGYTENSVASTFPFVLIGTAPHATFSYFLQPNGTTTALNSGDRITFPSTTVGSTSTIVVTVSNAGTTI